MNLYTWNVPINGGHARVSVVVLANDVKEAQKLAMSEMGQPEYQKEVYDYVTNHPPSEYSKPKALIVSVMIPTVL